MGRPGPSKTLETIVAAVGKHAAGATFIDVAASLEPLAPMRTVQRWLNVVVRQQRVVRVGKGPATRYKLPDPVPSDPLSGCSPEGRALHRLVTQPLAARAPADYRRVALDCYRANETYSLPAEVRTRSAATGDAGAWRQPPNFERTVLALVSRCLWLEQAMSDAPDVASLHPRAARRAAGVSATVLPADRGAARPGSIFGALTDADLATWLAQPERPGVRADVQLAWNIRAMLTEWTVRAPAAALTPDLLQQVFDRVTRQPNGGGAMAAQRVLAKHIQPGPTFALLRASVLTLPATVYEPPSDRWLIRTCFETVLRVANGIADPVERAFFLLTHLLYLLPFDRCNATLALLTMNVPLLAAGLRPVTFAAVQPGDLLAGIRAVWELNRTELLGDTFAAAT